METPEAEKVDQTVEDILPDNPGATFAPRRDGGVAATARHRPGEPGPPRAERLQRSISVASSDSPIPPPDSELDSVDPDRDYVLRKVIGQGGFGEVWEAQQIALHRAVAVKRLRQDLREQLIPDGSDANAYVADFRQEALTTASLDHPNIVPIYDIGFDDAGFPLLAMKLVRGRPWDSMLYTDFQELSVSDFLAKHIPILASVAQAIAFAHSRGVIHRDIKASQVMVGEFGEVYLMDWGLAVKYHLERMANPVAPGKVPVVVDNATNPAGTVAYMAAEQTFRSPTFLGPWTDVFLLGGTLFFLLTGRNPHEGGSAKSVFYRAAYSTVEPPEQRSPNREVPQELSEICQHAMVRRPADRIESAREFHRALQDYLAGTGRRRESTAITDALAERLAEGGLTYDEYAACGAELARASSLWAGNAALGGLRELLMRDYASAALKNGDLILARVQAHQLPDGDTRHDLETQIEYAESRARMIRRQRVFALSISGLLMGMMLVGGLLSTREISRERDAADAARERAVNARESAEELIRYMVIDLTDKLRSLGRTELLADTGVKVQEYFDALPEEERNPASEVRRTQALRQLAYTRDAQGDAASQLAFARTGVELSRQLLTEGAEYRDEKVVNLAEALVAYGDALRSVSMMAEAIAAYDECTNLLRPIKETNFRVEFVSAMYATSLIQRSKVEIQLNNMDVATKCLEEAMSVLKEGAARVPDRPAWHRLHAVAASQLSLIEGGRGNLESELRWMEEAREQCVLRLRLEPLSPLALREVATAYGRMAVLYDRSSKFVEAEAAYRAEVKASEDIYRVDPLNAFWARDLAIALASSSAFYQARGDLGLAGENLERARDVIERLTNAGIDAPQYLDTQSGIYARLASLRETQGNFAEAGDYYTSATTIMGRLIEQSPNNASLRQRRARTIVAFADLVEQRGQTREALAILEKVVAETRELLAADPQNQRVASDLAVYLNRTGGILSSVGELDAALSHLTESLEKFESIASDGRGTARQRGQTAITRSGLARVKLKRGDIAGARELALSGCALHREVAQELQTPSAISSRAFSLMILGDVENQDGNSAKATAAWQEGFDTIEPIAKSSSDSAILFRYVQLAIRLEKLDTARSVAASLVELGFRDPAFIEVLRENGFPIPSEASPSGG